MVRRNLHAPGPRTAAPPLTLPHPIHPAAQDLNCAPGKWKHGVGCTACPEGLVRRPVRAPTIAGSAFLRLQPEGFGCYVPDDECRRYGPKSPKC